MSAGKHYGDPCESDTCDLNKNGKCQKYAELYDPNLSQDEKMHMLTDIAFQHFMMLKAAQAELTSLIQIAESILTGENVDDILSDIESKLGDHADS